MADLCRGTAHGHRDDVQAYLGHPGESPWPRREPQLRQPRDLRAFSGRDSLFGSATTFAAPGFNLDERQYGATANDDV